MRRQTIHRARSSSSPLFKLPAADLLPAILAHLAPPDLAALARTARCLREPCTRALYAHLALGSFGALCLLVRTLEARRELGLLVRGFEEEEGRPFLIVEGAAEMLPRALRAMPRVRALALASPLAAVSPALPALGDLESLRLGDATPETLDVLAHVRPVRALCLRQRSVGWSTDCEDAGALRVAAYLLRARGVLRTLEIQGTLLGPVLQAHPDTRWPNVCSLTVYDCTSATRAAVSIAFPNALCHFQYSDDPGVLSSCTSKLPWETRILPVENPKRSRMENVLRGPLVWMLLGALSGGMMVFLR